MFFSFFFFFSPFIHIVFSLEELKINSIENSLRLLLLHFHQVFFSFVWNAKPSENEQSKTDVKSFKPQSVSSPFSSRIVFFRHRGFGTIKRHLNILCFSSYSLLSLFLYYFAIRLRTWDWTHTQNSTHNKHKNHKNKNEKTNYLFIK